MRAAAVAFAALDERGGCAVVHGSVFVALQRLHGLSLADLTALVMVQWSGAQASWIGNAGRLWES